MTLTRVEVDQLYSSRVLFLGIDFGGRADWMMDG